jgi:hypothetical protein
LQADELCEYGGEQRRHRAQLEKRAA